MPPDGIRQEPWTFTTQGVCAVIHFPVVASLRVTGGGQGQGADGGRKVADICREHGVSQATYYQWKAKFGGMEASDIRRLKELEEENTKLKLSNGIEK